ncbi:F-type H+-transporting ATPase subunit gamma [Arcanobacterium wilhelmae]|uniref:ATP synthase gamma chain n=1 Tax=Arcanobacterium wilhelmae TaxID=1803177 RepID=A0ABT9N9Y1_9ACTO|nr:F0F1 ATP synthase subunit gamma [Arcanobacterium wilhelmae]MDP9800503.1 F-type H+-transporting ATPase subunit gamma [Arcanobacterium wilhelmae]WFN89922.1 F0F1 ATP synthase subunit gamma [Arcanobacterium wilhelmae]
MSGAQRVYKQKIRATGTLEKVFRAMELIAASRIGKAKNRALAQDPYTRALTESIELVSAHARDNHPMLNERHDTKRVAILVVTSDRGMAGAYSSNVLRATEKLIDDLREDGKEPILYVFGRRGESYFRFRGVEIEKSWEGESDKPSADTSAEIAEELQMRFLADTHEGGVAEVHVVFTRFESMVKQSVEIRRMLPLAIVDSEESEHQPEALYEYEPSAEEVFEALLPMYVNQRVHSVLLLAAASELSSRQQAMHSATENAQDLIRNYTRLANNARQSEITTEITEIISGADSLKNG